VVKAGGPVGPPILTTNGRTRNRQATRVAHNAPMTNRPAAASQAAVWSALITVYILWGSTYLAIAFVVETMPPFLAGGARFLLAGAVLIGFLLARDRWSRRGAVDAPPLQAPRAIEWRTALIVGTLLLLGGNGGVMLAEQTVPSGIAAVLIATTPIWFSLFDALVTRRPPSRLAIGGVLIGLVGVAILLLPTDGVEQFDPFGIGILVLAAICWASGSIYARQAPLPASRLLGAGMQQVSGGAVLLLVGAATGELAAFDPAAVSTESMLGLAFLVVFGSLVAFSAYSWLLHHAPITTVATYAYVNPLVAVALGIAFRGESLTPRSLLAGAIIIGAVVAMVSGRPSQAEEPGPSPDAATLEAEPPTDR
jgi:drug/metabolite transporter (DMT)-like permease